MMGFGICGASQGARAIVWFLTAGVLGLPAFAQVLVAPAGNRGAIRLHNTDLAVMEAGEERKDLPCLVVPEKPFLGFDLQFHSGYDISIPLEELAGNEDLLTIVFRVVPDGRAEAPTYFTQKIRVPAIEEEAKGDALLQGGFDVGVGKYKVDLLVRDRAERICSLSWDIEAKLPSKDAQIALTMGEGAIQPVESAQFREEPPATRTTEQDPLNLKILINFAPQKALASSLRPVDTAALADLASGTGGSSFEAASTDDLTKVYSELGSAIGYDVEQQEVTWKVLAGALAALMAVGALSLAWFQRLP